MFMGAAPLAVAASTSDGEPDAPANARLDVSTPVSTRRTFGDMAPGDAETTTIVIANKGATAVRYVVASSGSNPDHKALKDQLRLTIRTADTTTPTTSCNDFDGTLLFAGALDAPTIDPADATLRAHSTQPLCFRTYLPIETGNEYQNATTTATFRFRGTALAKVSVPPAGPR
jgi:hypothetical protein